MIDYLDIARARMTGRPLSDTEIDTLIHTPVDEIFPMMAGADMLRRHYFDNKVHLCAITNAKSGRCSEDCRFCSQSKFVNTDIDIYPLKKAQSLKEEISEMEPTPVNRFSMVTSGRGLSKEEIKEICKTGPEPRDIKLCASLGILDIEDFEALKKAGITRYHHNLETARSLFDDICTTHSYDERIQTIKNAQKAGMTICSGGIFGVGETMEQVVELAQDLAALDVDAVPMNFLTPIPGTPMADTPPLSPMDCLKTIALMRYILPQKEILVCGGRMLNLKQLSGLVFFAGASGIMTGNYLTTQGNQLEQDMALLKDLGLEPRQE